jgi:hypothetical protein
MKVKYETISYKTIQNIYDTTKTIHKGKFVALNNYIK